MTLEEAVSRTEHMRAFQEAHGGRDAAALGVVLAVARAFPKMLGALEAASEDHELHCSGDQSERGCGLRDDMREAIRAAREAVKP